MVSHFLTTTAAEADYDDFLKSEPATSFPLSITLSIFYLKSITLSIFYLTIERATHKIKLLRLYRVLY